MKQIITSALYLLTIFAVSNYIFEPTYLYYELKWLDIPMHIMGGFGVASLTGAVLAYRSKESTFGKLFAVYVVAALAWELYEYGHDIALDQEWNGWLDTTKDLVNGFLGMVAAYLFIRK